MADMVLTRIVVDPPKRLQEVARRVDRYDEWCADFEFLIPEPAEHQRSNQNDSFSSDAFSCMEILRDWRQLYWGCHSTAREWNTDTTCISIETKWTPPRK